LERDIRRLFGLPFGSRVDDFLFLAGLRRRHGNKRPCPCGGGIRTGRCHGAAVHVARRRLGRAWCREQLAQILWHRRAEDRR
jgi:hypothetical protein